MRVAEGEREREVHACKFASKNQVLLVDRRPQKQRVAHIALPRFDPDRPRSPTWSAWHAEATRRFVGFSHNEWTRPRSPFRRRRVPMTTETAHLWRVLFVRTTAIALLVAVVWIQAAAAGLGSTVRPSLPHAPAVAPAAAVGAPRALAQAPSRIPKIVHFVFGMKNPDPAFGFLNYASVMSAIRVLRPSRVLVHAHFEPVGLFWDLVRPKVELRRVPLVQEVFGNSVSHYAHRADVVRLNALIEFGGIYLDSDVIVLRSFDNLLEHETVMGQEGENGRVGLCNAVILAAPGSRFLRRWLDNYRSFNESQWNRHSVVLPSLLSRQHPDEVHVLPFNAFFWPLWDKPGLERLFRSNEYKYEPNYAVHLWSSAASPFLDGFSLQWLKENRSVLLSRLDSFVPHPIFSVIVPCYNQAQYIWETLDSVANQTFTSWEIIVIDDKSPDECWRAANNWTETKYRGVAQENRPSIRVMVNEVNKGLSESRNVAIRASRGQFICALDADDKIAPNYFMEAQKAVIADPSAGLLYGDQKFFGEGTFLWNVRDFDFLRPLAEGPLPVMSLYRRSYWDRVGGYSSALPRGNEDYDFWLKLVEIGAHSRRLRGIQSYYRVKKRSMMRDGAPFRQEEHVMMRLRHVGLFHPAQVLKDLRALQTLAPSTEEILLQKMEKTDDHDVREWAFLWILAKEVFREDWERARSNPFVRDLNPARSVPHRLGWHVDFLIAKFLCGSSKLEEGRSLFRRLAEHDARLVSLDSFRLELSRCEEAVPFKDPVVTQLQ